MDSHNGDTSQIPEDVKPAWFNLARHAQAVCKDNNGYALLTFQVAVRLNEPVLWAPPIITKLSPMSLASEEMSPELLGVLMAFLKKDGSGAS